MIEIKKIVMTSGYLNIYFTVKDTNSISIGDVLKDQGKSKNSMVFFRVDEITIKGNRVVFKASELNGNQNYKVSKLQKMKLSVIEDNELKTHAQYYYGG